jgi:DNA-binding transcriptional LysR family regulator
LVFDLLLEEEVLLVLPRDHALVKTRRPAEPRISLRRLASESFILVRRPGAPGLHAPITLAYLDANRNPAATNFIALARKHASAINGRRRR